ncbi:hypothetical protein [Halovenus sp. HT40]|uniref:hypothetical protein n=1 Tax=Halovenus sp. HT40 TaxID=3126691 RepID=UPI00300EC00A
MRSQFLRRFRGAGYLKIIGVILAVLGTVVITGTSGPLLSGAGTSDAGLSFVLRIILETTLLFTITAVLVAVFSLLVSGFTWLLSLRKNRSRTPATLIVIGVNFLVAAVILFHIPTLQPGPQFDIVSMLVASVGYLIPLFIAFFVTGQAKSKAKQSAKPK